MRAVACLLSLTLLGFAGSAFDCGAQRKRAAPEAGGATAALDPEPGVRLDTVPCWFESEPKDATTRVECAVLHVPERWGVDTEPRVALPVVILRTGGATDWATVVPGGGGPGGSLGLESDDAAVTVGNHEAFATASGADLVLVDQRGAGIARPAYRCAEIGDAALRLLAADLSVEAEAALWADTASRCRARLEAGGIALEAYDTAASVRDLDALRRALGYRRWSLFGTSYAGEIALAYAREHPASVRSLVLDSPSIPGADLVSPAWFQHVVDVLFARCAADARCQRDYPALGDTLARLLARFAAKPLAITVSHPRTLAPVPVLVTPVRLLDVIFSAMYDTDRIHEIPRMIAAADRGSYDWLTQFVREHVAMTLDPRFSQALLGAVPCQESFPHEDLARAEREAAQLRWARAYVGVQRVTTELCRAWNVRAVAAPDPPVRFDGPVLMFAGELDPAIPLSDLQRAVKSLPRATLIALPATGHAPDSARWHCIDPLIEDFLADPERLLDADAIASCREEAQHTEFATLPLPESLPDSAQAGSSLP
jgi:pimeloyl-ACP methyl ester carboxylesterase